MSYNWQFRYSHRPRGDSWVRLQGGPAWFKESEQDQYILLHQLPLPSPAYLGLLDPMRDSKARVGLTGEATHWHSVQENISLCSLLTSSTATVGIPCLVGPRQRSCPQEPGLCLSKALENQTGYSNPGSLPIRT